MGAPADRIVRVETFRVPLAVRAVRAQGKGDVSGAVENAYLRLEAESGAVGWGEAAPWTVFTGTVEAALGALHAHLRPLLLGADPSRIPALMAAADARLVGAFEAKAAMETALLDLEGRRRGLPVWALLGGEARDRIPLSVSLADPDWDRDLALAERIHADGVRIVKLKTGTRGHRFDLDRIEALRKRFGDSLEIRADYNQALAAHDALRPLRDLDGLGLGFIEQPVPARAWDALAQIRGALDTPVMADESVFGPEDMAAALRAGLADAVSIKIMKSGGPTRAMTTARMAAAAGWAAYGGDMFESGIAHLAGAHMIAACAEISLGCEFYQARYHLEQDLLAASFPIEAGEVVVPAAPGLGVEVDEERLRALAVEALE